MKRSLEDSLDCPSRRARRAERWSWLSAVVLATTSLAACGENKTSPAPASSSAVAIPSSPPVQSAPAPSASAATTPKAPPESVAAQHVLIAYRGAKNAPKTVTRSKAEAKARAEEVVAKARAGADFTALVAEYTEDPGTKDNRGNLGKFRRDRMTKPFADAAFALGVDETSAPVETEFGFHVIRRNQ